MWRVEGKNIEKTKTKKNKKQKTKKQKKKKTYKLLPLPLPYILPLLQGKFLRTLAHDDQFSDVLLTVFVHKILDQVNNNNNNNRQ